MEVNVAAGKSFRLVFTTDFQAASPNYLVSLLMAGAFPLFKFRNSLTTINPYTPRAFTIEGLINRQLRMRLFSRR